MGSLNKKASGAQCFIMALGLFWDIATDLPWTPNGVGSLEPRGYCIFLPGAHYLTINSPDGADSLLNKLLLLLLCQPITEQLLLEVVQWVVKCWSCCILFQLNRSHEYVMHVVFLLYLEKKVAMTRYTSLDRCLVSSSLSLSPGFKYLKTKDKSDLSPTWEYGFWI